MKMIEICFTGGETDSISFNEYKIPFEQMQHIAKEIGKKPKFVGFITETKDFYMVNPDLVSLVSIMEVKE